MGSSDMMRALPSSTRAAIFVAATLLLIAILPAVGGCGDTAPRSENYFALVGGNSWLYEGSQEGQKVSVEMKVQKPDASLNLSPGILDIAVTGSLGDYRVSESGLFLEAGPTEVKLWGVKESGGTPRFFGSPYIWLRQPLQVGTSYNTAIQGAPAPARMLVSGRQKVPTPWGERDGFMLEEVGGSGAAAGVRLVFVPYLGFTRINTPDWPELQLKDASLR
jgi:hypothetical protein